MKKYWIIILCFSIIVNSCIVDKYMYKVFISEDEYKIMKSYIMKNKKYIKGISLKKDYIYSNNIELLKKIKIRLTGFEEHMHGPSYPIIIERLGKYYMVFPRGLQNLNWMDDEEIFENVSKNEIKEIIINIQNIMDYLSEDDFLEYYFEYSDGIYKSKTIIKYELFKKDENEDDRIFLNTLACLSISKYNLLVEISRVRIYVKEIKIEKIL
ncbi:hypothetical protein FACS189491_11350 [Spirochaetia bacterium]|nr:hypothetical protein FACS189491_11350 [Spirochaetia bacterium]